MQNHLEDLNYNIINCKRCRRLRTHCKNVASKKVARFKNHDYWGKPVPSFGHPDAEVLIVGLAPAAHGANRTGRMFTGDSSGDWLFKALFNAGFCNQPVSVSADDGLKLSNVYITSIVHCAPPGNKPLQTEIDNCLEYAGKEIEHLYNLIVIICLGRLSFMNVRKIIGLKEKEFGHGLIYEIDKRLKLICSYHPSRQNTQTGKLKWPEWEKIFHITNEILA